MEDWKLGWAAGIIDGEGAIGIRVDPIPGYTSHSYKLSVRVGNTNPKIINALHFTFGGSVQTLKKDERHNTKTNYCWGLFGDGALIFLKLIEPFIAGKKNEVALAIRFQEGKCNEEKDLLIEEMKRIRGS